MAFCFSWTLVFAVLLFCFVWSLLWKSSSNGGVLDWELVIRLERTRKLLCKVLGASSNECFPPKNCEFISVACSILGVPNSSSKNWVLVWRSVPGLVNSCVQICRSFRSFAWEHFWSKHSLGFFACLNDGLN